MSHERKKAGQRKDKKMARMREAVEFKHETAVPKPTTDQHDIVSYKQGSQRDRNVRPSERHSQHGQPPGGD